MLNIASERIHKKVDEILEDRKGKEHAAYLKLWELLEKENRELSEMFGDLKLSNAIRKLAGWDCNGVIFEERLSMFSDEARQTVKRINETFR